VLVHGHESSFNERGLDSTPQAVSSKLQINLGVDLHGQHLAQQGGAEALVPRWVNQRAVVLDPHQAHRSLAFYLTHVPCQIHAPLGDRQRSKLGASLPTVVGRAGPGSWASISGRTGSPAQDDRFSLLADELTTKRLELLSELVPHARVIALMVNPNNTNAKRNIAIAEDFARAKGLQLPIVKATTAGEIDDAFASLLPLHAGALVVSADPFLSNQRVQLAALALRHAVPAIYAWREFAAAGGLISYGSSLTNAFRLIGIYAGKILNGANPADMPVQQPTTFELVINLKTARTLGLDIPQQLLAEADELIE
jgi:ABC transporter substrate binding protein